MTTSTPETKISIPLWRRWQLVRILGVIVVLTLLLAILSWALLPGYVKRIAAEQTRTQIGRKLDIDEIHFSPFQLILTADGVRLYEADQKAVAFAVKELVIKLSLSSVFHQALVLSELQLSAADVHLVRLSADGHGLYNFSDVLVKIAAMPKSDNPFRFAMANIQVKNSAIDLDDKVLAKQFKITDLNIGVPFISNFPKAIDSFVDPHLSGRINGAGFALNARAKPFSKSLATTLAIDLEQLDLSQYVAYVPVALPVQIARAKLSTKLDLNFKREPQAQVLLSGDVHLQDVDIKDSQATDLLKLADLHAQIKQMDVMTASAELTQLHLTSPQVWIDFSQKNGFNWANLSTPDSKKAAQSRLAKAIPDKKSQVVAVPAPALPFISIHDLQIHGGEVHVSDAVHAQPAQTLELQHLVLQVKGLSTAKDAPAAPVKLTLATNTDEKVDFEGELQALAGSLKGKLTLNDIELSHYQNFISPFLRANLSAKLNAKTELDFNPERFSLNELSVNLDHLRLQGKPDDGSVAFDSLVIEKARLDTQAKTLTVPAVSLNGVKTDLRRDNQAVLGFQHWLAVNSKAGQDAPATVKAQAVGPAWRVNLEQFDLKDSEIAFNDQSVNPTVKLNANGINLSLSQFKSDLSQAFKLSLKSHFNRKGQFNFNAQATPQLKQLSVTLDAQSLPVAAFYPYFSKLLNVEITKGRASAKGKLDMSDVLLDQRQFAYNGSLSFNDFKIYENGSDDDFLEWKDIIFDGINAKIGSAQPVINLKKLTLNDFFARVVLSEKARLNLQDILVKNTSAKTAPDSVITPANPVPTSVASVSASAAETSKADNKVAGKAAMPTVIRITQTELHGGNVNFTDNFIKPNYHANLTNISGSIGLLASDNPQPANLELHGTVDNDAPLLISGAINPLASPIFLDITGSANGLELTRLTPYSAKYAGYPIEKGKLSMQVSYHVENQQLKAENSITLDQLTFGEYVDGPNVTKLPVMLAVALLRDNQGRIAINLPISGSLSDPQFSVGGIIFKVFVNLITKAVTSPFAILGSMFGGSEELSYVEFNPGLAVLTPPAMAKLDNLAKALNHRSGLKLDIVGRVDPESDGVGVRKTVLESKLRDAKWRELHQKDRSIKLADIELNADDRNKYLQIVYQAEKFDKPRNLIGMAKTLQTPEAEALILKNMSVSEDDLRVLAQQREDVVRDYLENTGKVQRDRLYLIAPKLDSSGIKDKGASNRVDFSLK
ncbi:DUF748 domain-containing protein [Undibacterium jejuense]|uniref:DUF748 domain-containing protein n=1 Tax=Undibacterium jejuense TaxID=1344949 RepID=A0A923HC77_9BURK|nr:DUF748 domain-containing protein [Undibacterium jejuense]